MGATAIAAAVAARRRSSLGPRDVGDFCNDTSAAATAAGANADADAAAAAAASAATHSEQAPIGATRASSLCAWKTKDHSSHTHDANCSGNQLRCRGSEGVAEADIKA